VIAVFASECAKYYLAFTNTYGFCPSGRVIVNL
jgi:hypothetical protein